MVVPIRPESGVLSRVLNFRVRTSRGSYYDVPPSRCQNPRTLTGVRVSRYSVTGLTRTYTTEVRGVKTNSNGISPERHHRDGDIVQKWTKEFDKYCRKLYIYLFRYGDVENARRKDVLIVVYLWRLQISNTEDFVT